MSNQKNEKVPLPAGGIRNALVANGLFAALAVFAALIVGVGDAQAIAINDGFGFPTAFKKGAVMARAVILNENGQPILVEYNKDGSEAGVVPIPSDYQDRIHTLQIISANEYLAQQERLNAWRQRHAKDLALDAELMDRERFLGQSYRLADNQTEVTPPSLHPSVKSVLVRGQSARILPDPNQLVLLAFTVDLTQNYTPPNGTQSLVVTPEGRVIASSSQNIGPRAGFFGKADEAQTVLSGGRKAEDKIFGPVSGVKVYVDEFVYPGGVAVTGEDGKYHINYRLPPCPGFSFEYRTDLWAELRYANFSPLGAPVLPYYLRFQDSDLCFGFLAIPPNPLSLASQMDYVGAINIMASASIANYNIDLWVDVMFLSGRVLLQNPDGSRVAIGERTAYSVFDREHHDQAVTQTWYDFDGDGRQDTAVLGKLIEETQEDGTVTRTFYPVGHELVGSTGDVQGIYLSSRGETTGAPDLIRQADTAKKLENTGLLQTISTEDLKNTDILVFRESTGQLILERRGLRDAELEGRAQVGVGRGGDSVFYRVMLRGPKDSQQNLGATDHSGTFTEWATRNQLAEPFRAREADHLKSGEWIRLIAINRASGYMGSQRIQLSDASANGGGLLSFPVGDVVMRPPNLRVWAERSYDVEQGLTKGKERNYLVGAEGASLASDAQVTVYSEWLDEDGRPLPEGLGAGDGKQYGLTGRLAKVVAPNVLQAASQGDGQSNSNLANFPIAPGLHKQVLQFKDNPARPEHYYVHVTGTQVNENPSFTAAGPAVDAPLDSRPGKLTPFLSPLYDEDSHWQEYNAYRKIKRAQAANNDPNTIAPAKPLPAYAWYYRPEYQFSRLSLEIEEIIRHPRDEGENGQTAEELLNVELPVIRSDDQLVEVFYSLIDPELERLAAIDGDQDFVLSLGEYEVLVQPGSSEPARFEDLEHLDRLDPEDFLTIRLYLNQDAGNVLWEWSFSRNGLHVYFKVPGNTEDNPEGRDDIAILSLLNETKPETKPAVIVRTLGGMRLRYRYIPPAGGAQDTVQITKITWKFGHRGRVCAGYGVDVQADCTVVEKDKAHEGNTNGNIYWEPVDADGNVLWSTDLDAPSALDARYLITHADGSPPTPGQYQRNFQIKTRLLKPDVDPRDGSDVQILEAMLWQFGLSPQKGSAGGQGARINSDRGKGRGRTHTCDGEESKRRDVFSTGWSTCTAPYVSLEGMIKRFQGRNISAKEGSKQVHGGVSGTGVDGEVGKNTLRQLKHVWVAYWAAYEAYKSDSGVITRTDSRMQGWLEAATKIWQDGFGADVPITYTNEKHAAVLEKAGLAEDWKSREALLLAWKLSEADSHWGAGVTQETPYRILEGGDEFGSISFSQILYRYRYSRKPCTVHANSALNLYSPAENIMAFAVHTGAKPVKETDGKISCPGAFEAAFASKSLGNAYNLPDLKGYRHGDSGAVTAVGTHDDDYEILAKAIGAYNGGTGFTLGRSWPQVLKETVPVKEWVNEIDKCFSCAYSIKVRNENFGMPHRTYIWSGDGLGLDVNGDGKIADIVADPAATPPVQAVAETTVPWCFAYGEKEWKDGVKFEKAQEKAKGDLLADPPIQPAGRMACKAGAQS